MRWVSFNVNISISLNVFYIFNLFNPKVSYPYMMLLWTLSWVSRRIPSFPPGVAVQEAKDQGFIDMSPVCLAGPPIYLDHT